MLILIQWFSYGAIVLILIINKDGIQIVFDNTYRREFRSSTDIGAFAWILNFVAELNFEKIHFIKKNLINTGYINFIAEFYVKNMHFYID